MEKILNDVKEMFETKNSKELINVSSKTRFMFELMMNLKKEGHKVLIFSMSK